MKKADATEPQKAFAFMTVRWRNTAYGGNDTGIEAFSVRGNGAFTFCGVNRGQHVELDHMVPEELSCAGVTYVEMAVAIPSAA